MSLVELAGSKIDVPSIKPLFDRLSANIRNTTRAKEFLQMMDAVSATAVGATAPDFMLKNADGIPIRLSGFKGKYVLLDFWASWCIPCRQENPNVVKAYQQYRDKDFTVFGVSLDAHGKKEGCEEKHSIKNWPLF